MLSEVALYALFMVWQEAGLGEAIAAKWVSGGNPRARVGGQGHGHGPQFFLNNVGGNLEEVNDVHNDGAYGASPPSFLEAGETISGGNRCIAKAVGAVAHSSATPPTPSPLSAMARTYTPLRRCATAVQGCASAVLHTLHVTMIVGRVGNWTMVQPG